MHIWLFCLTPNNWRSNNCGEGWYSRWNVSEARSHGIYMQSRNGHEWHGVTMGWYMVYMTNAVWGGLSVYDRRGLIEIKAEIKWWLSKWKWVGSENVCRVGEGILGWEDAWAVGRGIFRLGTAWAVHGGISGEGDACRGGGNSGARDACGGGGGSNLLKPNGM